MTRTRLSLILLLFFTAVGLLNLLPITVSLSDERPIVANGPNASMLELLQAEVLDTMSPDLP